VPAPGATPATPAAVSALAGPGRTTETTNYEVSKTTRHTVSPQGQLARLSVAVILDDERVAATGAAGAASTTKPWDATGIQRIQGLVAAAVGLDKERGDQLTVENIAFDVPQEQAMPVAPGVGAQITDAMKQQWPMALRGLGILLVASFALFGVLRPLMRRATSLTAVPALPANGSAARLPTVQEMEGQIDAELDAAASAQGRRLPVLTQRVVKLANDEPEQLARIVRGWIAEGDR
jgi:flagellar M-ring protein FliF